MVSLPENGMQPTQEKGFGAQTLEKAKEAIVGIAHVVQTVGRIVMPRDLTEYYNNKEHNPDFGKITRGGRVVDTPVTGNGTRI